jgi:hypothetical protein
MKTQHELYKEAMRYIRCNLSSRGKVTEERDIIKVSFDYGHDVLRFYLADMDGFHAGDISRDCVTLGYKRHKKHGTFIGYDYEAALKWDIENAGCKLSPSY